VGVAKATISFDAWKEVSVAPATLEIAIIGPEEARGEENRE
jgi:hypothetical protein